MKRLIPVVILGVVIGALAVLQAAAPQGTVSLVAPATPLLTAVDPYANPDRPNPLNPQRPYWYVADATGLRVLRLDTNVEVGSVAWPVAPATIDLALPNGTLTSVPPPLAGWVPVRLMLPTPGGEDIGAEAVEGATTIAYVVMARSGYEWQSSDGRYRDRIVPNTDPERESSMMVMVNVTDPTAPTIHAGALLGHEANQMAWDPNAGLMYVANMPSLSLPANLASFVSKITPPESGPEPKKLYTPNTLYALCGPEVEWSGEAKIAEKTGIPVNEPGVWACDAINGAGEGEGPFTYVFTGLPNWLIAHTDKATGALDGILYGTPTQMGTYTFVVTVTDNDPAAVAPNDVASAVVTIEVKASVTEFAGGEMEVEAGVTTSFPMWGTPVDPSRSACETEPGATPVPAWFEVIPVPGGCVLIMNSPPLQGEYYDFWFSNINRKDTRTGVYYSAPEGGTPGRWPVSAEVLGVYGFDPLPAGVGLTGIAWHEVDMIPGEPDKYVVNGELFGAGTDGQLYKITVPYETTDTIEELPPGSLSMVVETNEVTAVGPIGTAGTLGNLVVEADRDIYVAAGSSVLRVTLTPGTPDTINPVGQIPIPAQATHLALDSDLEPAVKADLGGPGQIDHNLLWVTSPTSGNVALIDTHTLSVQTFDTGAANGGVAVDSVTTGLAYVAVPSTGTVALFGSGSPWNTPPRLALISPAEAPMIDPTLLTIGEPASLTSIAIGWPIPTVSMVGTVPGLTFTPNNNGTLTISGAPDASSCLPGAPGYPSCVYTLTATATNGLLPDSTLQFTLTVNALAAPGILTPNTATLAVGVASQFKVEATGTPTPILTVTGDLPGGVTFHDNAACSPAKGEAEATGVVIDPCTGSAFLGGIPTTAGTYPLTITATNSQGTASQLFNLVVSAMTPQQLVITPPVSQSVPEGQIAAFAADATGVPTPTLQWQVLSTDAGATWADIPGATSGIYTTVATLAMSGYQYRAVFTSGSNVVASVPATLTVIAPGQPVINVTPPVLSLTYNGGTTPLVRNVSVATGAAPLPYTLTSSATWLTATPASGTTPANVPISVNPSGFVAGSYTGTITVASAGMANSPLTIPVTVSKSDSPGDFSFMVGVGSAPESIALDRKTHHLFIGEMSEGIETGLENPNVEVLPVPSPVFHVDPNTRSVVGTVTVHSSGEYLAVNSTTGLVYAANEVTNEVAIIDGATNNVVGYIPLVYEGASYMPLQIAIDEARNLIYVGTRAPEPADPVRTNGAFSCKAIHEMPEDTYECWNPGKVFVIDGTTNQLALDGTGKPMFFPAGSDPEGVVFAAVTGKVYASNEDDGTITIAQGATRTARGINPPKVINTIVRGYAKPGWWQPTCDANNFCGEQGEAALWPVGSKCNGIAGYQGDEADKMTVDPRGDVYITDDRYRVAKISGQTGQVVQVLEIAGYECAVPEGSGDSPEIQTRNTANNIAFSAPDNGVARNQEKGWRLYVTSEQDTVAVIDPLKMTVEKTITIPGASHLDAITIDPGLRTVYITDEAGALWILRFAAGQ